MFTSGRLKQMFKNFKHPIETTLKNISELEGKDADAKKLMKSFALDIIGNVVFSLRTNSYKEDEWSKKVMELFKVRNFALILFFMLPKPLLRLFQISFLRLVF